MTEQTPDGYERRIAELERRVAALEAGTVTTPTPATARPEPVTVPPAPRPQSRWSGEEWLDRGEGWLGRGGVALVVAGLVILFRYAVDHGWITPALRVATGLLLGAGMLGAGLRFFAERRRYRQILMGGGIVILFITGLAASELYGLVPAGVTLLFHGAVAVVAFAIAIRERDTVMASIAAAGSMVPPVFLLSDSVAGPVLWLYLLIVASWSALMVARTEPGPFSVVATAAALLATFQPVGAAPVTRATAATSMAAIWVGFAALPLLRSKVPWALPLQLQSERAAGTRFLQPFIVTVAVTGAAQQSLWRSPDAFEYGVAIAAALFVLVALATREPRATQPASGGARTADILLDSDDFAAACVVAIACAAVAASGILPDTSRGFGLAALGATAFLAAPLLRAQALRILTHVLFGLVAMAFIASTDHIARAPAFDRAALGYAGAAALAAAVLRQATTKAERLAYGAGIFIAVHVLLATELAAVPGAAWLASASYALTGSALVVAGLRARSLLLQRAGLVSLGLLVLRLFAYDLANTDAGVRIVLFLASGFAFLALSWLFRGRREAGAGPEAGTSLRG